MRTLNYIAALATLATTLQAQPLTIDRKTQIRNFAHTHATNAEGGQLAITAFLQSILSGGATATKLATVNTSLTSGLCLEADANGNIRVASNGAACGGVSSIGLTGSANQIAVTGATPIINSGSWALSFPAGGVTLPGTTTLNLGTGTLKATSGAVGLVAGSASNCVLVDGSSAACTAGSVVSVGMTGDNVIYETSVAGSPVTGTGTLVPALKTQTANFVLAGPTSGGALAPTFRALVSTDIPSSGVQSHSFTCNIGSATGASVILTGDTGCYSDNGPYAGTINRVDILGNATALAACSITVDIWKANGAYPTSGDKISASAPATLSSATVSDNGSRSGWTNSVTSGDKWNASVSSVTGCVYAQVKVFYQ